MAAAIVLWLPSGIWWCALLLPLGMLFFRRFRRLGVLALCLVLMMVSYRHLFVSSTAHLDGHADTLVGQVVTEPARGRMYVLRVTESDRLRAGTQVALYCSVERTPSLYDTVTASVRLYAARPDQHHYAAQGVYVYAFLDTDAQDDVLIRSPSDTVLSPAILQKSRAALVDVLRHHLTADESGVLSALCLGERRYVSPLIQESFRGSGLSHLLVVSGLHLSAVAVAIRTLFRRLRLGKGLSAALTVVTIWVFALLVGTTPSVLRAAMMCTVWLVGDVLFCRSDGLNSLGLAAMVLLSANPYTLYNVSFQLSFAATAGVLLLAPRLVAPPRDRALDSWWVALRQWVGRAARNAAAVSASALLFAMPIACFHYGGFPLLAIPANVLAVGAAGVALMTGWLGALAGLVPFLSWLCRGLLWIAGLLAQYLCGVARWASPPWAWISAGQVWQWLLVAGLCGVAAYGILCRMHTRRVMAGLIALVVLTVGIGSPLTLTSVRMTVIAADAGGGVWLQQGPHSVLLVSHSDVLASIQGNTAHPAEVVLVAQGAIADVGCSDEWADTVCVAVGAAVAQSDGVEICPAGGTVYPWDDSHIKVHSDGWYLMQTGGYAVAVCVDLAEPCPFRGVPCIYLGGLPDTPPSDPYTAVCSEGWLRRNRPTLTGRETLVTEDRITFVPRMGEWSVLPWL